MPMRRRSCVAEDPTRTTRRRPTPGGWRHTDMSGVMKTCSRNGLRSFACSYGWREETRSSTDNVNYTGASKEVSTRLPLLQTLKFGEPVVEKQLHFAGRTIPMLLDENVRDAFFFRIRIIHIVAINEDDDIGILLDRAALAEICQHRNRRFPAFDRAAQL